MTAFPTTAELATPSANLSRAASALHPLTIAASVAVILASTTAMAYMFGIVGPQSRQSAVATAQASELSAAKTTAPAVAAIAPTAAPVLEAVAPVAVAPVVAVAAAPAARQVTPTPRPVYQAPPRAVAKPATPIVVAQNIPQQTYPAPAPNSGTENRDVIATAPVYSPSTSSPSTASQTNSAPSIYAPPVYAPPVVAAAPVPVAINQYAGTVTQIREQTTAAAQGNGVGAVIGGVVGGALGNTLGKGSGKVGATVLGAIGGGLIGNSIEKSQRQTKSYIVSIRMDDGSTRQMTYQSAPRFSIGDKIDVRDAGSQQTGQTYRTPAPIVNQNNPYSNV